MIPLQLIDTLFIDDKFDVQAFLNAHQTEAPTSVRVNLQKNIQLAADAGFEIENTIAWCNHSYHLKVRPNFTYSPLFHAGCYYVQEASSMFLQHIVSTINANQNITTALDLCAAPGGKSTLLLDALPIECLLVSNEVINTRVSTLVENLNKWGRENVVVTNNDSERFSQLSSFFDLVVVDAPCSGSGLFRKDKKAIGEWSLNNVDLCCKRQKRILSEAVESIADSGYLVYSTCSYSRQENEDIVDWLLQTYSFETVQIPIQDDWNIIETKSELESGYGYRFYPHLTNSEGFFVGVLKLNSGKNTASMKPNKNPLYTKLNSSKFEDFVTLKPQQIIVTRNDFNCAINQNHFALIEKISQVATVKKVGIEIGNFQQKDFIPTHALAMSNMVNSKVYKVELSETEALKYLKKENINVAETHIGWALATYKNNALGWLKLLGNRVNNYYPKSSRILH